MRQTLGRILASAPAAIPYAGQAYATFRADLDLAEVKQLLQEIRDLNVDQHRDLAQQMLTTQEVLTSLITQMQKLVSHPPTEKLVAVVPVGGKGGSMRPITSVMPKCLVYIGERSLLQHILNSFVPFPDVFRKVIVVSREFSSAIHENVRQGGYGSFVECRNINKDVPAALLELKPELEQSPFLLHYNDILIDKIDWAVVKERYMSFRRKRVLGMLLCSTYHPTGIGVISEREPEMVDRFEEKPQNMQLFGFLANLGVAVFSPGFLDHIHYNDQGIFEKSINRSLESGAQLSLFRVGEWYHVHEMTTLYKIQRMRGEIDQ
jgi:NDP-sugar pyrophosphorylase family protein